MGCGLNPTKPTDEKGFPLAPTAREKNFPHHSPLWRPCNDVQGHLLWGQCEDVHAAHVPYLGLLQQQAMASARTHFTHQPPAPCPRSQSPAGPPRHPTCGNPCLRILISRRFTAASVSTSRTFLPIPA